MPICHYVTISATVIISKMKFVYCSPHIGHLVIIALEPLMALIGSYKVYEVVCCSQVSNAFSLGLIICGLSHFYYFIAETVQVHVSVLCNVISSANISNTNCISNVHLNNLFRQKLTLSLSINEFVFLKLKDKLWGYTSPISGRQTTNCLKHLNLI